ncbi:zinc transporter 1 isoform X2 [Acanthochromis polyacanthus]|uniref:Zinc transporter 1-like n=2 Tax=Acanthochromis polyacanthus TaxID=80966 RepID=A0A3Q1GIS4_9TELE|nr:zinc transporter 1 isoform X2 [Acanthochromis polyacanthus]
MRLLHWCMLGGTVLLLMCEVAISQLCKSLITLVDGFHTLFLLMHMALPLHQTAIKSLISSLDSSASPPPVSSSSPDSSITSPAAIQTNTEASTIPDQSKHEAATLVNHTSPPGAPACGLSYPSSRILAVGAFISALLLASLCTSYLMEIVNFCLDPHPVQRPLLLVVVGAASLFHKMLVFWLNWDQLQDERLVGSRQLETKSHIQVNHEALAEEESIGREESQDIGQSLVLSAVDDSLHSGAFVLCNPGPSRAPDTDFQTPHQQPEVHLHDCEEGSGAEDLKAFKCESSSTDVTERQKYNICWGHIDSQNASKTSPTCKSSRHTERPEASRQRPVCLPSFVFAIRGLFTSLLALINSLVMLLIAPRFLHSSGACNVLVYLDPGLSLLAVITLLATTLPQVYRYGLLLLQASPPQICVSDLGRKIASVPGVQAVHDLHIWQLTESLLVASVHVHCYAGLPAHRCADLLSGVTKVLQSVGVTCCTVQPEFASCSGFSAGGSSDASLVIHREDPSPPPPLACSLACGKACAGSMCCSLLKEETRNLLAPPSGETREEPQTLVIENTFL